MTATPFTEREKELIRCVDFALLNLKPLRGSGMMLLNVGDPNATEYKTEHWTEWFMRTLKDCGLNYDAELVAYSRAGVVEQKRMLKDPAFAAKVERARRSA